MNLTGTCESIPLAETHTGMCLAAPKNSKEASVAERSEGGNIDNSLKGAA